MELRPADQPWAHRTAFFRDPDGNIVEIYADI
jgi:catechol 2,3-dioxygenase-like lactoylglutathione lyase family enzyme